MINASTINTLGSSLLVSMQNGVVPVLVKCAVCLGALLALYFLIRFMRRHFAGGSDSYGVGDTCWYDEGFTDGGHFTYQSSRDNYSHVIE